MYKYCPLCASQITKLLLNELLDFQGSPPCLKKVPPNEQEVKQVYQETCMDEQGAPEDIPSRVSMHFFTSEIRGSV